MKRVFYFQALFFLILSACKPQSSAVIELGKFEENFVQVTITLSRAENHRAVLSAVFVPVESDLRLYSKDVPRSGVEGLGRPALIELPPDSDIIVTGDMMESVSPQTIFMEISDLPVYPAGAVTLSLPILLPTGSNWVQREVLITYMACSDYSCRAPVEGKVVPILIPQRDAWN